MSFVRLSVLRCTVSRLRRSFCVCVCASKNTENRKKKRKKVKKERKKCLALLVFGRSRVQTSSSRPTSVVFLSPFRQLLGYYLKLRHNRFPLQTFRVVIIYLIIKRCNLRYRQCHKINHKWLKYNGAQNANSQGRIKGFVGPRHFLRFEKYCWNYSVLSIIRADGRGGVVQIIRNLFFIHRPFL
jgi:hypothetical protein